MDSTEAQVVLAKKRGRGPGSPTKATVDAGSAFPNKKKKKSKKAEDRNVLNHLPPEVNEVTTFLWGLGDQQEEILSTMIITIKRIVGEGNESVMSGLLEAQKAWKLSNREHCQNMVTLLERNGVIGFGAVQVPSGSPDVLGSIVLAQKKSSGDGNEDNGNANGGGLEPAKAMKTYE